MLVVVAKDASGATLTDRITTWSSSDASKATVSSGLVTGVAVGTATITASVDGKTANVEVRVEEGAVVGSAGGSFTAREGIITVAIPAGALSQPTSLTVVPAASPPASARLIAGTAFHLAPAAATFAQPVTLGIRYDPSLVTAGNSESELQLYEVLAGAWTLVSGSTVDTGNRTVTGSSSRFGTFAVMMRPRVETITIGGDLSAVPVSATRQLSVTLKDLDGATITRPVAWASSDAGVLSIDAATGLATAKKPGTVSITATSEGKSGSASLTVIPGPPARLIAWAGNNQSVPTGEAVPVPPSVIITDAADNPIPNVAVTFAVTAGGGSITGASATTNPAGIATVGSWTLGAAAGPNTLIATSSAVSGVTITFHAAGVVGTLAGFAGNNQTARPGSPVATAPSVIVTSHEGLPVAGVAVTFAVTSGGGSIPSGTVNTNADGIAAVASWTLGPETGTNTLSASASGLDGSPFVFSATAALPTVTAMTIAGGNNQSGQPGSALPVAPSVRVTDADGAGVAGVVVTFNVTAGGGSLSSTTATSTADGTATAGTWTLGASQGANIVVATTPDLPGASVTFSATAGPPPPVRIQGSDGEGQSAPVNTFIPTPPSVIVTDASGSPVGGVQVVFSIGLGGGSVTGADAVTDAAGVARVGAWRLGATVGHQTLHATAPGLSGSPVIFNAQGIAVQPVASTMSIHAGNNQSGTAGQAVAVRPAVKITDSNGAPVAGVAVNFSISTGGGSISGASTVSDASGVATVGSWTLGIGSNSLTASSPGLNGSPLTFFATGAAEVQVVTFGDSNTDLGFSGTNPAAVVASYISSANPAIKLAPGAPHSGLQLAGKIESRWKGSSSRSIKVVNHGIAGTMSGTGRTSVGAPNALEQVGGISRFRGEVMGDAYPWNGGEETNDFYPSGAIPRVQAFVPRTSDFAYVSIGTNDIAQGVPPATIAANLSAMIAEWTGRGLPANRFLITTVPPRAPGGSSSIPDINSRIRALAASTGARLIDLSAFVSNDDGLTWKTGMQLDGDPLHYSEAVRNWLADQVVSIMLSF